MSSGQQVTFKTLGFKLETHVHTSLTQDLDKGLNGMVWTGLTLPQAGGWTRCGAGGDFERSLLYPSNFASVQHPTDIY